MCHQLYVFAANANEISFCVSFFQDKHILETYFRLSYTSSATAFWKKKGQNDWTDNSGKHAC